MPPLRKTAYFGWLPQDGLFRIVTKIQISNGIDFEQIKLPTHSTDTTDALHLICVAEIHYWHGIDRAVAGLGQYYAANPTQQVHLHIVGDFFSDTERNAVVPLIEQYGLQDHVTLHGRQHGEALDALFDRADMAVGSLGRHRSQITHIKTLKNREYAARGLAFVYAETDADFEHQPYVLKAPADESPLDIAAVVAFYRTLKLTPEEIRASIADLAWAVQMGHVLQQYKVLQ